LTLTQVNIPVQESPRTPYLRAVYQDLLGRQLGDPVEEAGVMVWLDQLLQGQPAALVVRRIEQSPEYLTRMVEGLYQRLLGRAADSFGRSVFVGFLEAGGTTAAVEAKILGSPEYGHSHTDGT